MEKDRSTLTVLLITALLAPFVSITALLSTVPVAGATTETVKLYPSDDSYIDNSSKDANFGSQNHIWIASYLEDPGLTIRMYLKFDLSSLPDGVRINSARLFLYCSKVTDPLAGASDLEIREVLDDTWTESSITWNNQPAYGSLLDTKLVDTAGIWWDLDVTSFVQGEFTGDKVVSLLGKMIIENEYWDRHVVFSSKENDGYDPYLEVTYSTLVPAVIDIDPDTLNLKSNGNWITAYIELSGQDVSEIAIGSIKLTAAGKEFAVDPAAPTAIGDYDSDGISDLMVKFDRAAIVDWLSVVDVDNEEAGTADGLGLKIAGEVAGLYFEGIDVIKVIGPKK